MGVELLHRQPHPTGVQVTHQQLGTCCVQLLGQCVTHIAQALHRNAQAFEVAAAQAGQAGCTDTGEYPHGRMRRGITRGRCAGHMGRTLGDAIHVQRGGAAVHSDDETPL
ncbi:hypothetical protein D3C79_878640 [compost metagenome]